MSARFASRLGLLLLAALVVGLLAAAVSQLWRAGSAVYERERLRAEAPQVVATAVASLAREGALALALIPDWPQTLEPDQWQVLDQWLLRVSRDVVASQPGLDGGYYAAQQERYLGTSTGPDRTTENSERQDPATTPLLNLPLDLLDSQVRQAWSRERPVALLVELDEGTVALRVEPIRINSRRVAAIWSAQRLDEAVSRQRILALYRQAATLAIGGVAAAVLLVVGLARKIRLQAQEQQRLQVELRRNERLTALGKLVAGVAHEVRNPLAGIRSTVQLWQRGLEPDRESQDSLIAEVDRLESLVSRLLQFSRADSRPRQPGDLNALLTGAARLAAPVAAEQGVAITLDLDSSLPEVPMDAPAILQLLRNLTTNALQAMPEGGTLVMQTRRSASRDAVQAIISDTGPGLSDEARLHLFEPFYTTRPDGTGLGLAIAREIALGHQGDLRLAPPSSSPGAVLVLELPTTLAPALSGAKN